MFSLYVYFMPRLELVGCRAFVCMSASIVMSVKKANLCSECIIIYTVGVVF